jgi:tripartite-type tricarboxylate transporter receptor subunit TctC
VPIVVENKAGAAGTLGAESVAHAPADGYTLLLASAETHAIAPNMRRNLPYDPEKAFVAIGPFAVNPFAVVTRPDFPAGTTKELVALIKRDPGKYTYSSAGLGSTSQIAMETWKGVAGLDILHVPFQGQAPALTSLLGSHTDLQMLPAGSAVGLLKSGKVKVFAVSTADRFFDMPTVPTLREEGYAAMNFANWFGIVVPTGVPDPAAARLASALDAVIRAPDTRDRLRSLGLDLHPQMTQVEFQSFLTQEKSRWGEVIRSAGIKPE